VATLLAMGAQKIHAVEIDPEILQIGREIHPNDPYADPRVTVHTTDARSFLNESTESFDVIVFGTLDSMTRLSAMSNIRLDNFVYTREGLEAAASRLPPDGGLVLYFMIGQEFTREHLLLMLTETFGAVPRVHRGDYSLFNTIFMAGPAYSTRAVSVEDAESYAEITMPSDDWPYLYLPQPGISSFYLAMLAILATIGVLSVLLASPQMRHGLLRGGRGIDGEMFMYGFAFLLIETKFITSMNLLWGATWLTSAIVFGSILLVVLAGTLLTDRTLIPWRVSSTMLVLALPATYLLPLELLLSTSATVRLGLSVLFVGTPVFFASLCFAVHFKTRQAADVAFGWNLLGAVVGGLTEFFSMPLGFRALTLVAIVAYMTAFLLAGRERAAQGVHESP
jgi:hypothetical protein